MMNLLRQILRRTAPAGAVLAVWAGMPACQGGPVTSNSPPASGGGALGGSSQSTTNALAATNAASQQLREGDTIRISFPGAPSLDTTQTIRRDGKITLDMVGEVIAAGLTPGQLQDVLLEKYGPQLVLKEVYVTVQGSAFSVYVTGAVMRPGRITSEKVLTPLEAVLEAGLDQTRGNLKKVKVLREGENGTNEVFYLNLNDVMKGKSVKPFTLKPMDKIIVPEKFSWF
jgi:polysaccharide export outer membrane protein